MENYLTKPKLYNTGFLLDDRDSRIIQGLMPQGLSNNCFVGINKDNNNYYYNNYNISRSNLDTNPYYNNSKFPIKQPFVNYGIQSIPDDCLCLSNIMSP
jgi:hypothetical protein